MAKANSKTVDNATLDATIVAAWRSQGKSDVSQRKALALALSKRGAYDEALQDACRVAYMGGALNMTDAKVNELRLTENANLRPAEWKAVDGRFRQTWKRALGDAGLLTEQTRGGAHASTSPKDAAKKADAPVTVEAFHVPTLSSPSEWRAFLMTVSTMLNAAHAKGGAKLTGDYGTCARDAINAFGAAVRTPIGK